MSSSAIDGFINRCQLPPFYTSKLKEHGISQFITLREMSIEQIHNIFGDCPEATILYTAIKKDNDNDNSVVRPGGSHSRNADDERQMGGQRTFGGRGRGNRGGAGNSRDHEGGIKLGMGGGHNDRGGFGGAPTEASGSHNDRMLDEEGHDGENRKDFSRKFSCTMNVCVDSFGFLLGKTNAILINIHKKYHTSNERFTKEKVEQYLTLNNTTQYPLIIYGPTQESLDCTKAEIEKAAGITRTKLAKRRFDSQCFELEHNTRCAYALALANIKAKGTPMHIDDNILKRVVEGSRFQSLGFIYHFSYGKATSVREKTDFVKDSCLVHMKGASVIIFTDELTVVHLMESRHMAVAFGVNRVCFCHRLMSRQDRYENLEAFKKGEVNDKGVICRVLITTVDTAKVVRKVIFPFVNFVIHLTFPRLAARVKEIYMLQANCASMAGKSGISLLMHFSSDEEIMKPLNEVYNIREMDESVFAEACSHLEYDTVDHPLTSLDAEPPANWREVMTEDDARKKEVRVLKTHKEKKKKL